jgi:hypothetical protein
MKNEMRILKGLVIVGAGWFLYWLGSNNGKNKAKEEFNKNQEAKNNNIAFIDVQYKEKTK